MKSVPLGLLVISFSFLFSQLNAQTVQWAHSATSQGYEDGNAITADDSGNVYVSGQIEYTTHFDGGMQLSSNGIHDIFVGKYSPDGTLKWVRNAGGRGGDVGYGVAVDNLHNCYATGEIEDTAQFSSTVSLVSAGGNDIFVSKYNMNGQLVWAKRFGSTESDKGYSLMTNSNGDIFLTGFYSAHIYFDNIHLTPAGLSDVYTVKMNSSGVVQWAKKGAGTDEDRGKGITFDNNGNIYVAGYFTDQATFSGTTITNNGTTGGFLVKYDPNGQLTWIKSNCCGTSEYDGIAIDENGFVYTTGYFEGSVTIGNTTLTSSGNADILIVKYDPSGNIIWAKKAGGPYEDMANGISLDSINHMLYITGQLDDHGYFDAHYAGAAGNRDVFIAAYDLDGNCQWVKPYGGTQRDIAYGITNDREGNIFCTGIYTGNATFGSYTLAGNLLSDYFIEKVSPSPVNPPTIAATNLSISTTNCSDLFLNFTPGNGAGRIIIAHQGSAVHLSPVNGTSYLANSIFGSGDNLGSGNYVVYKGNGNSVTVSGLTEGVTYYFAVFEYNGTGGSTAYLTNNPALVSKTSGTYTVNLQASSNSLCEGDTVILTASGGVTYSWSPASGLSATTGSSVHAFPVSATIYTVVATNNGCQVEDVVTIAVNPLPGVTFSFNNSICENDSPIILTGGSPLGGVYSGNGILSGSFDPSLSGLGPIPVTYFYTDGNGCSNSETSSITVNQIPVVTFSLNNSICENGSPVVLAGGSPLTGVYSGTGVVSGLFYPSLSGSGTIPIMYTYTDGNGCANSAASSISVNQSPLVSFSFSTSLCENTSPVILTGGSPLGGIYSGNGVLSGSLDPSLAGIGSIPVTYTYTDGNGCSDSSTTSIMVLAPPNVTIGNDTSICENNSITLNVGTGFSSYSWSNGSTQSSVTVDSSGTGIGTALVFVLVENSSGCSNSDTIQITFSVCMGIDDETGNPDLHIYPNPFSTTFHLCLDQQADIYIYDTAGKLAEEKLNMNGDVTLGESLATGLYTIIIIQKKSKSVFRIIKNPAY
ncbi:MAG: SBBP repeat-containing protein [Bacteroidetes bacterium]|nr:SBBP repeat-containing protein [Bacteroidota bacterium]